MIKDEKLKFWIEHNLNVLFVGRAGTGKTARVKEAFEKAGLKWLYFSSSTMDPWVDFIGIPREIKTEDGKSYLDLVRPKQFAEDEVEAIFFDELNRAKPKVRNAVLELIQFKSINGKKFNNLRMVWAAINPETKLGDTDEFEYDVDRLDPAQKDRFQIQIDVPYKPEKSYFVDKFGREQAESAIDWWDALEDKDKALVSPRRLDYTLDLYQIGGDIRDCLPNSVNVTKLVTELKNGSYMKHMKEAFESEDSKKAKEFLSVRNNYDNCIGHILKNEKMMKFFMPCVKEEDLINLMTENDAAYTYVVENCETFKETIGNILTVTSSSKLAKKLDKEEKLKNMIEKMKAEATMKQFNLFKFSNPSLNTIPVTTSQVGETFKDMKGDTFAGFVNDSKRINTALQKGTQYRVAVYFRILMNITDKENKEDYYSCLKTMFDIIGLSIKDSLKQAIFKELAPFVGYLLVKYASMTNQTPHQVLFDMLSKSEHKDRIEDFFISNSPVYM